MLLGENNNRGRYGAAENETNPIFGACQEEVRRNKQKHLRPPGAATVNKIYREECAFFPASAKGSEFSLATRVTMRSFPKGAFP